MGYKSKTEWLVTFRMSRLLLRFQALLHQFIYSRETFCCALLKCQTMTLATNITNEHGGSPIGESMLILPRWHWNSSPWVYVSSDSQTRILLSVSTARRACAFAASHPLDVKLRTFRRVSCRGTSLALLSTKSLNCPTARAGNHRHYMVIESSRLST